VALPAVEETLTLDLIAGRPRDTLLGLLSNDLLFPERVPTYGTRSPWWLRCQAGSTRTDCTQDADADTHPDLGDCAPSDSTIHPEVNTRSAGTEGTVVLPGDRNCDSWPR
jgi:hypothetical protein